MRLPWLTIRGPITRGDFSPATWRCKPPLEGNNQTVRHQRGVLSSRKREVDMHFHAQTGTNAFASSPYPISHPRVAVHPCHPLPVQATIHPSHQSQPGATSASSVEKKKKRAQPGPCVHSFLSPSSSHSPFNYKKLGQLNFSTLFLSSYPPWSLFCAPVETSQTAQRSLPSSLINTTAPPTGQNSLTCTRFSLQALYSTPPSPSPPPSRAY